VAVPRLTLKPIAVDDTVIASEQQLADAFTSAGQLPGKVDIASFVDRRYNAAVGPLVTATK
jgi:sulfonate transport system substrate-binding protein